MNRMLLPKTTGADIELGNFIFRDLVSQGRSAAEAVRLLLAEMPGVPSHYQLRDGNPLDRQRRFFASTASCAYDDSQHLELCLQETVDAREHIAAWHAALLRARDAQRAANAKLPGEDRIILLVANRDGFGASYGGHVNITIAREAFLRTIRDPVGIGHLASFQAALAPLLGQGKAGADSGVPAAFQLSQRADFMSVLVSSDTMINRSLLNSRDESHANQKIARQHIICFDSTLLDAGRLVLVSSMQLELCLVESGMLDPSLILADPIAAMQAWSRDPGLSVEQPLALGGTTTLVSLLRRYHEEMTRLVGTGACKGVVPGADDILAQFAAILDLAAARDFAGLARKVDWAAKLGLLSWAAQEHGLAWDSPEMKHLDMQFGAVEDGLFWDLLADGGVDRLVRDDEIIRHLHEPCDSTRAFTRSRLLRLAPPGAVHHVDWDRVVFGFQKPGQRKRFVTVTLDTPFAFGREHSGIAEAATLDEALETLDQKHGILSESTQLSALRITEVAANEDGDKKTIRFQETNEPTNP